MRTPRNFDERPKPRTRRFAVGPSVSPSVDAFALDFVMFTQDLQSSLLIHDADESGVSITFEGTDEETTRAKHICALLDEHLYHRRDSVLKAVSKVVSYLAYSGRALFEIVRDADGQVADLSQFPLHGTWLVCGNCMQVAPAGAVNTAESRYVFLRRADLWRIDMPRELGGYDGHRKLLANLSRWPSLGPKFYRKDMEVGHWPKDFVIKDYRRAYEMNRYRLTRKWGWSGRDWHPEYITEYYQFYRLLTFRWATEVLRRHVIEEFNILFRRLGIASSIRVSGLPSPEFILDARSRMQRGEIDFAEASKITAPPLH